MLTDLAIRNYAIVDQLEGLLVFGLDVAVVVAEDRDLRHLVADAQHVLRRRLAGEDELLLE